MELVITSINWCYHQQNLVVFKQVMRDLKRNNVLFGGKTRTSILVLIALLKESYPSELARLLDAKLYTIQGIVNAFESEGVLISRQVGRTRQISLNPRYVAAKELEALLWKLGASDVGLQELAAKKRSRPRRPGKPG